MKPLSFFDPIIVSVPKEKIYKRLNYRKGTTQLTALQAKELERDIEDALSLIVLRGAGSCVPILKRTDSETTISGGHVIRSKSVSSLLKNSSEIFLMGATAGHEIMEAIREDAEKNNLTHGVVLDAVASEMVDASLDWIMKYVNHELSREGKRLTKRRFSAGYGDLLLENQKWIYDFLSLDRLGVSMTEAFMLVPEKSVTAIAGIEDAAYLPSKD
ncbi:MAG: methionine synthase [Syntrophales bacterium]